jgi:actin-related protein
VLLLKTYHRAQSCHKLGRSFDRKTFSVSPELFTKRKLKEIRGVLLPKYPIEHGVVNNWDDVENLKNGKFNFFFVTGACCCSSTL